MTEALLRRHDLRLIPADGLAELELAKFPQGKMIRCTLKGARSSRALRHHYACLTALATAPGQGSKDAFHDLLKLECGLSTPVKKTNGEIVFVPDSVAFDRLKNEADFRAYKTRAWDVIRENFGIDPDTLDREGRAILGEQQ